MKLYLWIDGKQDGPYELEQIREMLGKGSIAAVTLAHAEDGSGDWSPVSSFPDVIQPPKQPDPPPPPAPAPVPEFTLPPVEDSGVAIALSIIGVLELIASPIAGLGVGSDNTFAGWVVFLSGFISGLIFLGFARVIDYTFQSSQRMRRIEMLIQKRFDDDKDAA